jgi:hypothetical protein
MPRTRNQLRALNQSQTGNASPTRGSVSGRNITIGTPDSASPQPLPQPLPQPVNEGMVSGLGSRHYASPSSTANDMASATTSGRKTRRAPTGTPNTVRVAARPATGATRNAPGKPAHIPDPATILKALVGESTFLKSRYGPEIY